MDLIEKELNKLQIYLLTKINDEWKECKDHVLKRGRGMKVYIAGSISNDPNYKTKFADMERKLKGFGFKVLNPTILPSDLDYEDYFPICYAMIDVADFVIVIDAEETSEGVKREIEYSNTTNKAVFKVLDLYNSFESEHERTYSYIVRFNKID